jgi:uncharacterized protein (TIGR03083 family)
MEKQDYLDAARRETDGLREAARTGIDAPVPSCPGWLVGDVLAHVGQAMNWMAEIVETRSQTPLRPRTNDHGYDWHAPGAEGWFIGARDRFLSVLGNTDPEEPVWSWAGDNRAVFWLRLETMEAAIHRWDAQGAHGRPDPIDTALAMDAIDATIRWFLPVRRTRSSLPDSGERYRFDQTDGPGRWLIRFANGTVEPGPGGEAADLVLSGPATDVLLFLWSRVPAPGVDVENRSDLLQRLIRLIPPL